MAKAEVVPATQELIDKLKGRFRSADTAEVYAMSGHDIDRAVDDGLKYSDLCFVGLWEKDPVAVFGVRSVGILEDEGMPWLLGTDRIREQGVRQAFIGLSEVFVRGMLERFEYLENFVDARNLTSIKWLKKIGFTVEAPQRMGFLNLPFRRFWARRKSNV